MNKKIIGIFTTSLLCGTMILPVNTGGVELLLIKESNDKVLKADQSNEFTSNLVEIEAHRQIYNGWKSPFSASNWTYGETPKVSAVSNYGTVRYKYLKKYNGGYINNYTQGIQEDVGTYKIVAYVDAGTLDSGDTYTGLSVKNPIEISISKATNEWKKRVSIDPVIYQGNPLEPSAEAKHGNVKYTYYKISSSGGHIDLSATPSEVGKYCVHASVTGTSNYTALNEEYNHYATFEIVKFQNSWTTQLSASNWTYGESNKIIEAKSKFGTPEHKYQMYNYNNRSWVDIAGLPSNVGSYRVNAIVKAGIDSESKQNYGQIETGYIRFSINQATDNYWTSQLTANSWNVGENPKISVEAKYGTISYEYEKFDGNSWIEIAGIPTECGSYRVRTRVEGNSNYNGIEWTEHKNFKINYINNEWRSMLDVSDWTYGEEKKITYAEADHGETEHIFEKYVNGKWEQISVFSEDSGKYRVKAYVVYDSEQGKIYAPLSTEYLEYTISKAVPNAKDQTLTVDYGTLKAELDALLADGYTLRETTQFVFFKSLDTTHNASELGNVGVYTFDGVYTHADTANYETKEVRITVNVTALDVSMSADLSKLETLGDVNNLVVKHNGVTLEEGKDYTVETIKGAQNRVEISFIGNYTGRITKDLKSESPATAPTETGNTGSTSNSSTTTGGTSTGSGAVNAGDTTNSAGLMSLLLGMAGVLTFFTKKKLSK